MPPPLRLSITDLRNLHNFPLVEAGESNVFEFEIWEPGSQVFFCQLHKHVDHGQTGVLIVTS